MRAAATGVVLDLFAGPGGWDVAARALGIDPIGIELDDAACATRDAAGLQTVQADVAELDPRGTCPTGCWGLIASPPCQAFSMAGVGAGRKAINAYVAAIGWMASGKPVPRDYLDEQCDDDRAHLVLEPLRWVLALEPRWIALEQVKPVLPVWEAMARALNTKGYGAWTGVLSSEQYGVPQTRKRAILIASLDGPVAKPEPTHQRYIPPRRRDEATESLFDAPEPERIVAPEDRGLLPWVSMAEALGWAEGRYPSPAPTVTSGGTAQGGVEVFASKASRARVERSVAADGQPPLYYRNGNQPNAARRREDEPAPTLHFGHALNSGIEWTTTPDQPWRPSEIADTGNTRGKGEVSSDSARVRPSDEPAPTLTTRADQMERRGDGPSPAGLDRRQGGAPVRSIDEPAHTMSSQGLAKGRDVWVPLSTAALQAEDWPENRPATTVAGDPRVFQPGGHHIEGQQSQNAVRVSLAEALVLQSFPPDYPVQGTRTKQFEQVGNAVPPLLAWHVLRAVVPEFVEAAA